MAQTTLLGSTGKKERITAEVLAEKQQSISISEFFTKNRHLLGFDNPRKALLTTVREAVDNALDACGEMKVLPEVRVIIDEISTDKYKVTVEDNGPGIVRQQIPNIFAKLLYGSKFHRLRQSRGAQGIGISAAALYGQLTTGKPIKIISKIDPKAKAHYYELHLNTKTNEPEIMKDEEREWENKDHGTKLQIELEGKYQQGKLSVDEFLQLTAIANPEASIIYKAPGAEAIEFARASQEIPKETKEIQPHPYGVELGTLMRMLKESKASSVQGFLQQDFCRVSASVAKEICEKAGIEERTKPHAIAREEVEKIFNAIKQTKIMAPPTDCLSPIGEEQLLKGLKKEITAEFYAAVTRSPVVYRGFPFQIECAIAFGGDLPKDELARVIRYANKVPLQHQPGACALTRSIIQTAWKNYGISQSKGTLPAGPLVISVHIASVWVPFTSESKEAVASYPDIIKEVRLALQDTGRKLALYIRKNIRAREQQERIGLFEKYIPELAASLAILTGEKKSDIEEELLKILKKELKGLLVEVKEAEKTEIIGENVAYGEKQKEIDNE
ncbi:MAG: DNA topoisomerase VI subunit B [archaeon GW2011_AR17]|nr:MAG: DNA topoisomerase VI subunit B [archaeon GW2011_AR17]MBS3154329.1 DNA topoisomerase VI subunit B [Candidatus Woesearchaeota archaeon]HIH15267.1 DNA topoisomerase VI subunit B [Nanoarchaeota archaeon]HIH58578.1 DNA topoisomerase VI subunit B [Nanoarchaeota archaeon]HII13773.1 DNA topoisomerase VI subunit B [Nanoarchaeota archaeon]